MGLGLAWWLGRQESPAAVRTKDAIRRDLPVAADLLAACTAVGRPVEPSLEAVAHAVGGPLGARLEAVLARITLGGDPLGEWRRLSDDALLGPLARTLVRSLESGALLSDGLSRLADDRRRERRTETQVKARNVGVRSAAPLAACFLPAFMLIGVVPTIAGAFSRLVL